MSPTTASVPSGSDPGRRTRATAWWPRAPNSAHVARPTKPLAPVTSTLIWAAPRSAPAPQDLEGGAAHVEQPLRHLLGRAAHRREDPEIAHHHRRVEGNVVADHLPVHD